MSEPKTCPCGAMAWQYDDKEWWPTNAEIDLYLVAKAESLFCPECGAHLLPNGDVEPRGEVVGRARIVYPIRDGFLSVAGLDITMLAETIRGEVLLVRPADPPDEPEGAE